MKTTFISPIILVSVWILGIFFLATDEVSASVFELAPNTHDPQTNLQPYCFLAKNPILSNGNLDFQKTNFVPISNDFLFQPDQEYWLKLKLKCTEENALEHWIHLGIHDEVTLYRDGQLIGQTGRSINNPNRMHPIHQDWVSLMPLSTKTTDYFFRIKTGRFHAAVSLFAKLNSLSNLEQIRNERIKNDLSHYFFRLSILAVIAFMSVVSFAQYITSSDKTYHRYSLYLLFTFFYLLNSFEQNSPFSFFLQNHLAAYYHALVIPLLMMSYFFYAQFVRCALDTRSKKAQFDRMLKSYGLMMLFFVFLDVLFGAILQVDFYPHLQSAMLISAFSLAIYIYFQIWKIKGMIAKLILTGSLIFSFGSFLGFLFLTFIDLPKGWGLFSEGLTFMQISVLVEVLFFTIALAYRSGQIEKDKAMAKAKLVTETYEKERLSYQNEKRKEFEIKRSQFFADTNHELRSPLTVIKGMTESLEGNDLQRKIILKNANNMLDLINNMLTLAKAESGDISANLLQDNFNTFCGSQMEAWAYYAKTKNIEVVYEPKKELILMDFDDRRMEQILSNLMSNAIKFTPSGGTITVQTDEKDQDLIVTIKDTGTGIAEKDLPRVFDRYYRTETSKNSNIEGTGIGLALVKKLVELANGSIAVYSQPDLGTSFTMHFPITKLAPYGKAKTSLNKLTQIEQPDDVSLSPAPEEAPLLLLVEDNSEILAHLKYSLGNQYNIITAINGSEGIDKATQFFPDLIISDIRMPVKDGLTLCETLKKDPRTSHIPIILLTASSTDEDKIKGLERGADAYVTKPFSRVELNLRIENLLQVKKTLHAYFSKNINTETIQKSQISKEDQQFLDQLVTFIKDNIADEQMDVKRMMTAVNVSRPTLHSKLKSLTGLSATQFKKQIKMQEAKRLLEKGHSNITELAFLLGYKYSNNFSKDFKKWYGVTPNKFGK